REIRVLRTDTAGGCAVPHPPALRSPFSRKYPLSPTRESPRSGSGTVLSFTSRFLNRRSVFMRRFLRCLPTAALIVLLTSALAWAQATAELNGRVTDESGAVLPGVTVTVTQT